MLAMIDFFYFDIDDTDYETLKSSTDFKYARHERLGNFDSFQAVGKYEESITIEGVLIVKKQQQLKEFELLGKMKTQHILTLPDGTCKSIVILNIETAKSNYLKSGEFLRQDYTLSLAVVGDGFGFDLVGEIADLVGGLL